MKKTLNEIAAAVNGRVIGDGNIVIERVSPLDAGQSGSISFLANPKYINHLDETKSSAVIVGKSISEANTNLLQVEDPYYTFKEVLLLLNPMPLVTKNHFHSTSVIENEVSLENPVQVDSLAYIGTGTKIGKGTCVGAMSYIGKNVKIGSDTYIHPRVTILDDSVVGDRVILHSGCVIGSDGFGNAKKNGKYEKIPQVGNVIIGDDVEIGANTTIDRATMGSTIIGQGCRIDNLVQIAHNVQIGEHTAIAAQTGIAGSTKIGNRVVIAGQVGMTGHINIGDDVIVSAQSGVTRDLKEKNYYMGTPAVVHRDYKKSTVLHQKLPEIYSRLKKLEK